MENFSATEVFQKKLTTDVFEQRKGLYLKHFLKKGLRATVKRKNKN